MKKIIYIIISTLLVLGALYAIHDIQTAQGIGYFFVLKYRCESGFFVNALVDFIYFFLFILFVFLAWRGGGNYEEASLGRAVIMYVGIMPFASPNALFSLLFETTFVETVYVGTTHSLILNAIGLRVPLCILAVGFLICVKGGKLKTREIVLLMFAAGLIVFHLFTGMYSEEVEFLIAYILYFVSFSCLERGGMDSLLLYGVLSGAALFNLLNVTAAW